MQIIFDMSKYEQIIDIQCNDWHCFNISEFERNIKNKLPAGLWRLCQILIILGVIFLIENVIR